MESISARFKGSRALCGFKEPHSGRWCPAELGTLVERYQVPGKVDIEDLWAGTASYLSGQKLGDWYLRPPAQGAFFRDNQGSYGVTFAKPGKRWRPLPKDLRTGGEPGNLGLIGEFPRLPATIICPVCRRPNAIASPPGAATAIM